MSDHFERLLSTVLVGAAVAIAVGLVHREFFSQPKSSAPTGTSAPRFENDWRDLLPAAEAIGDTAAPIKIVEFSDFECPYCRVFHKDLEEIIAANPKGIAGYFVHYPNAGHRFALPAARAAECARTHGRFREFVGLLLEKQDSLGIKSWGSYALEAGLPDTVAIRACALDSREVPRIAAGLALGQKRFVAGTPTILINGWRMQGSPPKSELERIIGELQKGKLPFGKTALLGVSSR